MTSFYKKILTGVVFVLVSLGQAYPFSVAYGMTTHKKQAVCCCRQTEDRCHCPHQHSPKVLAKHACHEDKSAGYKPLCAGKTQDEVLSFRSEPFLMSTPPVYFLFSRHVYYSPSSFQKEDHRDPPLSPPPRA